MAPGSTMARVSAAASLALLAVILRPLSTSPSHPLNMNMTVHFLAGSVQEELVVAATPVRARSDALRTRLRRDGWFWRPRDAALASAVEELADACFTPRTLPLDHHCFEAHFAAHPHAAAAVLAHVSALLREEVADLTVTCAPPERWVLFGRSGNKPQNVHYDTVATESAPCEEATAAAETGRMEVRFWLPLGTVESAPLLISNTTSLYDNSCARRETPSSPDRSPSWKIFSRDEFEADCAVAHLSSARRRAACGWRHTLGMRAGEALAFRNGMVLHGTAALGGPAVRISMAVDCSTTSPAAAAGAVSGLGSEGLGWVRGAAQAGPFAES